jgi:formylmethanofuran--tetrahydromethanopterin N-formyltransferase
MKLRGVLIEDTFAEAFTMRVARLIVTGRNLRWAREAALKLTGFATSVIGCKCEAGIERELTEAEAPDGRPGITACFDGLPDAPDRVGVGSALRFFGDGFQASKVVGGERFWRIPVMEGEFLVQEKFGMLKGVGGGNFLILARSADAALEAAEAAVDAIAGRNGVILPFPGGVVRSGSKVGARRIKTMIASTNDAYCPTLRAVTDSALPDEVNSVLELVINGTDVDAIAGAMRAGIDAACREGVVSISAGNYGGKLGPHHFYLRRIMGEATA